VTNAALPLTLAAHAKLNLRLEVGPLAGGLHTVISALAALDLADSVRFEWSPHGFRVACDLVDVAEKDNTAWRAAQALDVRLPSVRVGIHKRPAVASSTAEAYALLDQARVPHELGRRANADANAICDAFCHGDFELTAALLHNDFTPVIEAALPAVAQAHERLRRVGARATILCGSGSCVAGFFADIIAAQAAIGRISLDHGEWIRATTFARD